MDIKEFANDIKSITAIFMANCNDNCGDCESGNCTNKLERHLIDLGYQKNSIGKWLEDKESFTGYYCSKCGKEPMYAPVGGGQAHLTITKFCPSCGAKMEELRK